MSALTATLQGRVAADRLLVDTAVITRGGGAPTLDPNTGLITSPAGTTVHTGPCRVRQPNGLVEAEVLFGEQQVTTTRFVVDFPWDVTGIAIDDVITVTDSDDADLLTRSFRVTGPSLSTYVLGKRFPTEVVE